MLILYRILMISVSMLKTFNADELITMSFSRVLVAPFVVCGHSIGLSLWSNSFATTTGKKIEQNMFSQ